MQIFGVIAFIKLPNDTQTTVKRLKRREQKKQKKTKKQNRDGELNRLSVHLVEPCCFRSPVFGRMLV